MEITLPCVATILAEAIIILFLARVLSTMLLEDPRSGTAFRFRLGFYPIAIAAAMLANKLFDSRFRQLVKIR